MSVVIVHLFKGIEFVWVIFETISVYLPLVLVSVNCTTIVQSAKVITIDFFTFECISCF